MDKVRKYHATVPVTGKFDDDQLYLLLECAVRNVKELQAVSVTNKQLKASSVNSSDYSSYTNLLFYVADKFDKHNTAQNEGCGMVCWQQVYSHDQLYPDTVAYDIDTHLDLLLPSTDGNSQDNIIAAFQLQHGPR